MKLFRKKFEKLFLFFSTFLVVGIIAVVASFYANGYRFNSQNSKLVANGLAVIKSVPDGAQLLINGEPKTLTNTNLTLAPGNYDLTIKKDGYIEWNKRIEIRTGVVLELTAHLFKPVPSLSVITFMGVQNPIPTTDLTKIGYVVSPSKTTTTNPDLTSGLWVIETFDLPIGFTRDPKRITDGDLTEAVWQWSPDGREILLNIKNGWYLLDASDFTPQSQRVNITQTKDSIIELWDKEEALKQEALIDNLPPAAQDLLSNKISSLVFSPDEKMVLYKASSDYELPANLIDELPGSSTQKQNRDIKLGHTYVYDIKEDRNFLISDDPDIEITGNKTVNSSKMISWFPTARHLVISEPDNVSVIEYDGTNKVSVFTGNYVAPHAYPIVSKDRLIILTNLGASASPTNLYYVSIK